LVGIAYHVSRILLVGLLASQVMVVETGVLSPAAVSAKNNERAAMGGMDVSGFILNLWDLLFCRAAGLSTLRG
jgi:hypothetical protein